MKKFNFRFEAVEKVRKSHEDTALRALGAAQQELLLATSNQDLLKSKLNFALLRREKLANQLTKVLSFKIEEDFITGTKQRIIQAQQAILRAKRKVEKALSHYLKMRRQTRMMEVLREKAYADYKNESSRQEQKALDDLYIMRARMPKEFLG